MVRHLKEGKIRVNPSNFFVRVVIPKGWMVWMQDFWKLAYKKACRHDIRDEVSTRTSFFGFCYICKQ